MSKPSLLIIKSAGAGKALAALGIALALALMLWGVRFFDPLDIYIYDSALRYRVDHNPRRLHPSILNIDLNDSSERALGSRLDTRESFGDILGILGDYGASGAGLDFIFHRPQAGDRGMVLGGKYLYTLVHAVIPVPENESLFAPDIEEENRTVLAESVWHIKGDTEKIPRALSFIMSNPDISSSATQLGHIGMYPDKDGVYRRVPLFYRWEDAQTGESGVIPSLPLAIAASELFIDTGEIEFIPGKGVLLPMGEGEAPVIIPCDNEGVILVPYSARRETETFRKSFITLIEEADPFGAGEEDLFSKLSGNIGIISDTTTSKSDYGITPFETFFPRSGIHTAVLSGILYEAMGSAAFYSENSIGFKWAIIIAVLVLAAFFCLLARDSFFHLGHFFLFAALCLSGFALWNWGNKAPWVCVPAFLVLASWGFGFARRLFVRYREQLLFKSALTRYFPRSLAERIAAEGKTELAPAHKELTMLFADIVSFTRWSSDKEAGDVHGFLSDYLESMAEILFANGGTVDKFIGDGILAFFGDPIDQEDHARRCVNAAIEMQKKARELAVKWKHAGIDLKIRIGINSGTVIAGNLGTRTRIEYTVIGSAVNLAQRMESNAPHGGILVAEATWDKTKDYFTFSEKQDISVKGYDIPIYAWEVIQAY